MRARTRTVLAIAGAVLLQAVRAYLIERANQAKATPAAAPPP
jgi:hypothetical protein